MKKKTRVTFKVTYHLITKEGDMGMQSHYIYHDFKTRELAEEYVNKIQNTSFSSYYSEFSIEELNGNL